ncbi:MAG: hypothetical protein JW809_14115 [Pirellulales bacterium]|nr:hypothetical protein [Pirellulales bacterium]
MVDVDGFIRVFGPKHVRAVVVDLIDDHDDPTLANLTEQYAALEVPRAHRSVFDERFLRAIHFPRHRTIDGEVDLRAKLSALRELRELSTHR